ncbi:MAG: hypothetical protein LBU89_09370 [Fibromonadaceae bacterium]|nr:hypothetical protein [Fibromonadaceae bacterium]
MLVVCAFAQERHSPPVTGCYLVCENGELIVISPGTAPCLEMKKSEQNAKAVADCGGKDNRGNTHKWRSSSDPNLKGVFHTLGRHPRAKSEK